MSLPTCPIPLGDYPRVLLAHGGGGRLMHRLIDELFLAAFGAPATRHDGHVFTPPAGALAVTTDSFVVRPLFFPGADIGALAVYGTVNDLAMCGAAPHALAAAFVLEEGLAIETLWRVVHSAAAAARAAGVPIVTGDTKVVERGKGDGVFITTTGVGVVRPGVELAPAHIRPGDAVLLSGEVGNHGVAVMAAREGLTFTAPIESDAAPLWPLVEVLLTATGGAVHVLRDPTRGGLATTLCELAAGAELGLEIDAAAVPVAAPVGAACELLGLDPWYVANEGKLVAVLPGDHAPAALAALRGHPLGRDAAVIGTVTEAHPGRVVARNALGGTRVIEMLSGEQLPRIC